jgi:3',5'-cyclic AMP phosphodiesterase CpdA
MQIVQLSDLHLRAPGKLLYRQIDTAKYLAAAVARINALQPAPACVVLSGDLTDCGSAEEYAHLRQHLSSLTMPWHLMPGNHDHRENLRDAFPEQAWHGGALCCQRVDALGATLLLLDSIVPGSEGGAIGDAQLEWLDAAAPRDRACVLFLHHPPVATGIAGMDRIGLSNAGRLAEWLQGRPEIRLLAAGHVHRMVATEFAGRLLVIAPSPAHQIALDLSGDGSELAWCREPGGMVVHHFDGAHFVSHYLPIEMAETVRYE